MRTVTGHTSIGMAKVIPSVLLINERIIRHALFFWRKAVLSLFMSFPFTKPAVIFQYGFDKKKYNPNEMGPFRVKEL